MNIHRRLLVTTAVLAASCSIGLSAAVAAEHGTRDEAKALSDAAVAHIKKVGVDQAVKDFGADKARWMNKDLYPFVMDFGGIMRYHFNDKLIGKAALDVKDANGREFGREMLQLVKTKGAGWVDYEWAHPVTKKVEDKSGYVQRVPGTELYVGVGIYR